MQRDAMFGGDHLDGFVSALPEVANLPLYYVWSFPPLIFKLM